MSSSYTISLANSPLVLRAKAYGVPEAYADGSESKESSEDRLIPSLLDKIEQRMKWGKVCESPIEIDLAIALTCQAGDLFERYGVQIVPQFSWGRFRMDFAIVQSGVPVLFIECDGAEFHSSAEQLARDRKKDAAAEKAGITLLRFSGSDIYRYANNCVVSILRSLAS